jgi:hypothetical protein
MAYRDLLTVKRTSSGYAIVHREERRPLVKIVPDKVYPSMWRVVEESAHPPGYVLSDMVNLSRATDAAMVRAASMLDKRTAPAA